jgi:antitoxin component YwqK of YwqJK toxin-antitoxin module
MKALFLVIVLIAIGCEAFAQTQDMKNLTFKNSVFHLESEVYTGSYSSFYKNGKIKEEGYITNGKLDSVLTKYDKKGYKTSVSKLKNGKVYHEALFYPKSNNIKSEVLSQNGEEEVLYMNFYSNGQMQDRGYLKNGKRVGKWTYWKKDGRKDYETNIHPDAWERTDYIYSKDSTYSVTKLYNKYGREIKK